MNKEKNVLNGSLFSTFIAATEAHSRLTKAYNYNYQAGQVFFLLFDGNYVVLNGDNQKEKKKKIKDLLMYSYILTTEWIGENEDTQILQTNYHDEESCSLTKAYKYLGKEVVVKNEKEVMSRIYKLLTNRRNSDKDVCSGLQSLDYKRKEQEYGKALSIFPKKYDILLSQEYKGLSGKDLLQVFISGRHDDTEARYITKKGCIYKTDCGNPIISTGEKRWSMWKTCRRVKVVDGEEERKGFISSDEEEFKIDGVPVKELGRGQVAFGEYIAQEVKLVDGRVALIGQDLKRVKLDGKLVEMIKGTYSVLGQDVACYHLGTKHKRYVNKAGNVLKMNGKEIDDYYFINELDKRVYSLVGESGFRESDGSIFHKDGKKVMRVWRLPRIRKVRLEGENDYVELVPID